MGFKVLAQIAAASLPAGVAITWGGAYNVARGWFMPLLPVANNPSFAVNARP
jgi:hypothetical protein